MSVIPRKDESDKVIGYFAVVNYRDADGNRRQIRKNVKGKRAAETVERDFLTRRERSDLPGQKPAPTPREPLTVKSYLERWIAAVQVKESTLRRYRSLIDHVIREAGDTPLPEFSPSHVRDIYARMRDKGLSPKTALNVHRVLRMAMTEAQETDHLIPENPVSKKLAPRAPRYEPKPPTPDETKRIIDAASDWPDRETFSSYGALVAVAAWTGARQGELLSLRWDDVDLDAISIRQSKTATGRRRIPLTPGTVETLREHRLAQLKQRYELTDPETGETAWQDSGFVFTTAIGTQIDSGNFRRAWTAIVKRAGYLKALTATGKETVDELTEQEKRQHAIKTRFHDLRHGFATFLLSQNVHPKIVASLLGHSRITVTLDTYSHVIPSLGLEAQAMTAIDKALGAE